MANNQKYDTLADVAVVKKQNELTEFMKGSDRWKQFMSKLPASQQTQIAYDLFAYVNDNADVVKKMDANDFMKQVIKCYSRGLTLRDGDAYILPFSKGGKYDEEGGESDSGAATLVPGYKGVVRLATETGFFTDFDAVPVIAESIAKFDYRRSIPIFSESYLPNGTEKVVGYFGYFRTHTGLERQLYHSIQYFEDFAKKKSPSCKSRKYKDKSGKIVQVAGALRGPWLDDFDAMSRKTLLKELAKLAPRTMHDNSTYDDFQAVVDMDEDRPDYIDEDGVVTAPEKLAETAQSPKLAEAETKASSVKSQRSEATTAPKAADKSGQPKTEDDCFDCGAECADIVVKYSQEWYGETFCRKCQPKHSKIK